MADTSILHKVAYMCASHLENYFTIHKIIVEKLAIQLYKLKNSYMKDKKIRDVRKSARFKWINGRSYMGG